MIVLDTNILIEILKNNQSTIQKIQSFDDTLVISSISVMELYFGAFNKAELLKLEKFISLFPIIHLNESISKLSMKLIQEYTKSHHLDIPDSLIASTTLSIDGKLFTYNLKDFKYIKDLNLI